MPPSHLSKPKIPPAVLARLVLAIALDTAIQISWKLAVSGIPEAASALHTIAAACANPYFYFAMLAFGAQLVNWIHVLDQADVSFAQPFTALSYVTVLGLSSHSLHEKITAVKIAGVGMIFIGVFCISRTAYRTEIA